MKVLNIIWIYNHGSPRILSADDEFNRSVITNALKSQEIELKPRPTRRHNKCGLVERKNGTMKKIVERLANSDEQSDVELLVSKAAFLSNCLYGSKVMSAFELAKGYATSIVGNPSRKIPAEILNAHKQQAAILALNRLLKGRRVTHLMPGDINVGDDVPY